MLTMITQKEKESGFSPALDGDVDDCDEERFRAKRGAVRDGSQRAMALAKQEPDARCRAAVGLGDGGSTSSWRATRGKLRRRGQSRRRGERARRGHRRIGPIVVYGGREPWIALVGRERGRATAGERLRRRLGEHARRAAAARASELGATRRALGAASWVGARRRRRLGAR
jgi:hypothetical protein